MASPRVRDVLLRIRGDSSDGKQSLRDLAREVKDFGRLREAAQLEIEDAKAQAKMRAATHAVREFGELDAQARIDIQMTGAQAKLASVEKRLDNLRAKEVTPKVEVQIAKAMLDIERLEHHIDGLARKRVKIDVDRDADRGMQAFAASAKSAGAALGTAAQGVGLFAGIATASVPIIGGIGRGMVAVGSSSAQAGIAMVGLAVVVFPLVIAAMTLLAGAAVALAASLGAALAGAVALGVALGGILLPVLALGVAVAARFAKVLEAVKENEEKAADQAERTRDARQAAAVAEQGLVDARKRAADALVDAYRAEADAAEEVEDAIRGIARAELSRDQAQLNVKKAEQRLRELRRGTGLAGGTFDDEFKKFTDINFQPENLIKAIGQSPLGKAEGADKLDIAQAILDVRDARLSEKDAIDGVQDANTRLERAQQRQAEFAREGVKAYEPYAAALRAVRDAQRQVADADERVVEARKEQNEALKELTPRERRLATVLKDLKATLTTLFRPVTDRIFGALIDALAEVADFAKDPAIRSGMENLGTAVADAIRTLAEELGRPEVREGFGDLLDGAAAFIDYLTSNVVVRGFRLLLRIARAALEPLLSLVRRIGNRFRDWVDDMGEAGVRRVVRRIMRSFDAWMGLVGDLFELVKEFFGSANDSGDELVEHIRDIVKDWTKWLRENPDGVRDFFNEAVAFAEDFIDLLDRIMRLLDDVISAAETAVSIFDKVADFADKASAPATPFGALKWAAGQGWKIIKHAGGPIPGTGDVPVLAQGGEFMLRKEIAGAIGMNRLNALNSGRLDAIPAAASSSGGIHVENINLPPAPGHGQLGDPRVQAVMLARELRRRGGMAIGGGGVY